ncbi:MAG TPA: hypothetical protein VEZ90_00810 [Blastocatellia bacterium]|nr:hypothetical protein [Blastocatellia bacterium]
MATKTDPPEDELTRLRARVTELETQLDNRETKPKRSEYQERHEDIASKLGEETAKFFRGMALAGVELVRTSAGVMSSFADTVSDRNRRKGEESVSDLTKDLPGDIYFGVLNAVDHTLDIPGRVVGRLHESYSETK